MKNEKPIETRKLPSAVCPVCNKRRVLHHFGIVMGEHSVVTGSYPRPLCKGSGKAPPIDTVHIPIRT